MAVGVKTTLEGVATQLATLYEEWNQPAKAQQWRTTLSVL